MYQHRSVNIARNGNGIGMEFAGEMEMELECHLFISNKV